MSNLRDLYFQKVVSELMSKYSYSSVMQVPRILKVVLSMGVGAAVADKKILEHAVSDLSKISGRKPVVTKAKKAISNYKLRKDLPIGAMVTLRGSYMFDFLGKLINVVCPRIRDFRGLVNKFDGRGNYNFGLKEQIVFPEIDYEKTDRLRGLNITVVTTAPSDDECRSLLLALGFPIYVK